jgi:hypothetical protein
MSQQRIDGMFWCKSKQFPTLESFVAHKHQQWRVATHLVGPDMEMMLNLHGHQRWVGESLEPFQAVRFVPGVAVVEGGNRQ